ncbi:helix-turn-helix domain-containing protein [Ureibacillus thermophilus]|uniref:DNA-binding protein n=1 Tax=Ureibacillus thermophilus TaxID=367743 RepID=A0A4P6UQB6_9BACL|nr:helix-turn-helix domain-containing protein [Ureibacillus thermophilus]QBK25154.1 DNA-binding protein [Ureibacillus thermophilus]
MSITVYEQTQKEIECAYLEKDKAKIEKETLNVLNFVIIMFINKFEERINKTIFDPDDFQLNEEYLLSEENHQELKQWVNRLSLMEFPINDEEFGKLIIELEQWYYKIGGKNLKIYYNENYLLTPKEAANMLSVSTVTIHKYMKQGLENLETRSHRKIPKHAVLLWKDSKYCILMQRIYHEKKLRNQTPEDRIKEAKHELLDLQLKYGVDTLEQAWKLVDEEKMDISEYYEWEALEDELRELEGKLKGKGIRE